MNPNNPDADDLLALLNNKRKRRDTFVLSSDDIVNDLNITHWHNWLLGRQRISW